MAYDSRTVRATYSGPEWETDTPWHYRTKDGRNGSLNREVKRQTKRKARRIRKDTCQDMPRWTQTYGKRVYCRCCCTAQC